MTGANVSSPDTTGPDSWPARSVLMSARPVLAVAVLAAAAVSWAALPTGDARAGAKPALIAAAACAALSVTQLAEARLASRPGTPRRDAGVYQAALPGFLRRVRDGIRVGPWPQGLTVAVLGLEALHPARPWHTVVLGVAVLAFLLALHLAENADGPAILRPQLPADRGRNRPRRGVGRRRDAPGGQFRIRLAGRARGRGGHPGGGAGAAGLGSGITPDNAGSLTLPEP